MARIGFADEVRVQLIEEHKERKIDPNAGVWRKKCDELIAILRNVSDDNQAIDQMRQIFKQFKDQNGGMDPSVERYAPLLMVYFKLTRTPRFLVHRERAIYFAEKLKHDCYYSPSEACAPTVLIDYILNLKGFPNVLWTDHVIPTNMHLSNMNYETYVRLDEILDELYARDSANKIESKLVILHGLVGSGKSNLRHMIKEDYEVKYYPNEDAERALNALEFIPDQGSVVFIDDVDRFESQEVEFKFFSKLKAQVPQLKAPVIIAVSSWDMANRIKRSIPSQIVPINCFQSDFKLMFRAWCASMFIDYFKMSSVDTYLMENGFKFSQLMTQLQYEFCDLAEHLPSHPFAVHKIEKLQIEPPKRGGLLEVENEKSAFEVFEPQKLAEINSALGKAGLLGIRKAYGLTVKDRFDKLASDLDISLLQVDEISGPRDSMEGEGNVDGNEVENEAGFKEAKLDESEEHECNEEEDLPFSTRHCNQFWRFRGISERMLFDYNSAPAMLKRLDSQLNAPSSHATQGYRPYSGLTFDLSPLAIRDSNAFYMNHVEVMDRMGVYGVMDDNFKSQMKKKHAKSDYEAMCDDISKVLKYHKFAKLMGVDFSMDQIRLLRELRFHGAQIHVCRASPDSATSFRRSYRAPTKTDEFVYSATRGSGIPGHKDAEFLVEKQKEAKADEKNQYEVSEYAYYEEEEEYEDEQDYLDDLVLTDVLSPPKRPRLSSLEAEHFDIDVENVDEEGEEMVYAEGYAPERPHSSHFFRSKGFEKSVVGPTTKTLKHRKMTGDDSGGLNMGGEVKRPPMQVVVDENMGEEEELDVIDVEEILISDEREFEQ
ncbi:unnamed protein product [Bursaphelenchus xylophilus]|uniref:(pine wood nematode) hypothetical protein n=1 Tax=Bursaphelenchus xylophilus TaxID=6326 RepID=A0A1I7RWT4_BURXY|nr:unnamed protein product [Bursaphelenchus xylophilus]CAG9128661.1 unnamed protein product [Bursaphelenchus xylophilus]